jgi:hypothetical protein
MRALALALLLAGCAAAPQAPVTVQRPDYGIRCSFVSSPVACWKPAYRRLMTDLPARFA